MKSISSSIYRVQKKKKKKKKKEEEEAFNM